MIQIEYGASGQACPVIRCDDCGQMIRDARMAGVVWVPLAEWAEGAIHRPRILCKTNHCLSRTPGHPWEPLDTWLLYLTKNVGLTSRVKWHEAARHAAMRESL